MLQNKQTLSIAFSCNQNFNYRQAPLLLLHDMKLLQLGLVLRLHATQHIPYDHYKGVELKWLQKIKKGCKKR